LPLAFFLVCIGIGFVGAIAGVGGGVLFTPILLAFTNMNSEVIRATGLVLAYTTSMAAGMRYLKTGLAHLGLVLFVAATMAPATIIGSKFGIGIVLLMGEYGRALVRLMLGIIILIAVFAMVLKTKYWPEFKPSKISQTLGLQGTYYEETINKEVTYSATNVLIGTASIFAVGFIGGAFGLGGGWALVPVLNLIMNVPLKVAAAISVTSLGLGNVSGAWEYLHDGYVIPEMVALTVPGVLIGANLGSKAMRKIKAQTVRKYILAVLVISAIQLIQRGATAIWHL